MPRKKNHLSLLCLIVFLLSSLSSLLPSSSSPFFLCHQRLYDPKLRLCSIKLILSVFYYSDKYLTGITLRPIITCVRILCPLRLWSSQRLGSVGGDFNHFQLTSNEKNKRLSMSLTLYSKNMQCGGRAESTELFQTRGEYIHFCGQEGGHSLDRKSQKEAEVIV